MAISAGQVEKVVKGEGEVEHLQKKIRVTAALVSALSGHEAQ